MKDREPLQITRLKEIARTSTAPEVRELLWEIHRLHGVLKEDRRDIEVIHRLCLEGVKGRVAVVHAMRNRLINEPGALDVSGKSGE